MIFQKDEIIEIIEFIGSEPVYNEYDNILEFIIQYDSQDLRLKFINSENLIQLTIYTDSVKTIMILFKVKGGFSIIDDKYKWMKFSDCNFIHKRSIDTVNDERQGEFNFILRINPSFQIIFQDLD